MLLLWYCTSVVYIMSESSCNLRPRIKVRSRSETRSALSHGPSPVTRSAVARTKLTGEKGPVPGQHPVPEVVGSVVAPSPGPEMWSRQVFSYIYRGRSPGTISVKFSVMSTDGQGTWRRKIAGNLKRLSRVPVHERYRRSADVLTCVTERTRTRLGDRSFFVAGPCLWNSLPVTLRDTDITCTV